MPKRFYSWKPWQPGRLYHGERAADRRIVHGQCVGLRDQRELKLKTPKSLDFKDVPMEEDSYALQQRINSEPKPKKPKTLIPMEHEPNSLPMAAKEDSDALQQRINEAALAAQLAAAQADAKAAADQAELEERAVVYMEILQESLPEIFHSPRKSMAGYTPGSLKTPIEVGSWRGSGTVSASGNVGLVTAAALRFSTPFSPLSKLLASPVIQKLVRRHTHSLTLALARVRRPTRTSFTVPRAFCVRVCVADGRHSGGHTHLCR